MNGQLELRIITQPYSKVYWGYFRRLVFGNSLTKHINKLRIFSFIFRSDFFPPDFPHTALLSIRLNLPISHIWLGPRVIIHIWQQHIWSLSDHSVTPLPRWLGIDSLSQWTSQYMESSQTMLNIEWVTWLPRCQADGSGQLLCSCWVHYQCHIQWY